MAKCRYCGEPAGILRSHHEECAKLFSRGQDVIRQVVTSAITSGKGLEDLSRDIDAIALRHHVPNELAREIVADVFTSITDEYLNDGLLSDEESTRLQSFFRHLSPLASIQLNKHGAMTRISQAQVLNSILRGTVPDMGSTFPNVPFNLQKGESLVWVFYGVRYIEQRTRTRYEGSSDGFSVRIAQGLYYRTSAFRGNPVQYTETVQADTGVLGVTTKHLYFSGSVSKFRVRYDKIVEFTRYSDGVGIQRDVASAKPQVFVTGDGWFIFNLVRNLAAPHLETRA
jgi:hypothetical protein